MSDGGTVDQWKADAIANFGLQEHEADDLEMAGETFAVAQEAAGRALADALYVRVPAKIKQLCKDCLTSSLENAADWHMDKPRWRIFATAAERKMEELL